MAKTATAQLIGKALLQKLKSSNSSKRELAKECGYYSETKGGEIRVSLTDFYDAVLTVVLQKLGQQMVEWETVSVCSRLHAQIEPIQVASLST